MSAMDAHTAGNDVFSLARVMAILMKEFVQMRRDRLTFGMIIGIPILQLVLFGYAIMRPVVAASDLPTRAGMPLAMGLVLVSLFVVVSRKKALTQVVGFLMLENGIALLAILGTYGIPLIVELGVFLDALMGFLVMQIFVYRIHETFETIDVDQLDRLRH